MDESQQEEPRQRGCLRARLDAGFERARSGHPRQLRARSCGADLLFVPELPEVARMDDRGHQQVGDRIPHEVAEREQVADRHRRAEEPDLPSHDGLSGSEATGEPHMDDHPLRTRPWTMRSLRANAGTARVVSIVGTSSQSLSATARWGVTLSRASVNAAQRRP